MAQAKKGGERGKNGEWYKGGQFLPDSEHTIKGAQQQREFKPPTGKQCIAPYVWEKAPQDGLLAIYARIEYQSFITNRNECEYVKGEGLIGAVLEYVKDSDRHDVFLFSAAEDLPTNATLCKKVNGGWKAVWVETGTWITNGDMDNDTEITNPFFSGLVDRWNAGERWYKLEEDPYHYANQEEK